MSVSLLELEEAMTLREGISIEDRETAIKELGLWLHRYSAEQDHDNACLSDSESVARQIVTDL